MPRDAVLSSDDDAPEAVSMATGRAQELEQRRQHRAAGEAVRERRRAADVARKAQVQAALAEVLAAAAGSPEAAVAERPAAVETKTIKFADEEEAKEPEQHVLPDGSRVVLLGRVPGAATKELRRARKRLDAAKHRLLGNTAVPRISAAAGLHRRRARVAVEAEPGRGPSKGPVRPAGRRRAFKMASLL